MGQALQLHDRNPTGWPQVIQETKITSSATTVSGYWVYGLQRIAGAVNPTSTASVRYCGYDALGSVRFTTDTTGAIDFEFYYDAYGRTIASTPSGSFAERFRYAGEEWDADLGLYYLRARYYAPEYGRFWTMDSYEGNQSDPLSLNKYLYCHANPVNGTDPSGNFTLSDVNVTGAIQTTLNALRTSGPVRALQFAERVIDVANTFRDIASLFQNSSVLRDHLAGLISQMTGAQMSYDLRKLAAMNDGHISGISSRIVADFSQIVGRIRNNHGNLLKAALRSPQKATLVIGLPSLPGNFLGSSHVRPIPSIAARVGPFKVKFAVPIVERQLPFPARCLVRNCYQGQSLIRSGFFPGRRGFSQTLEAPAG